MVLWQGVGAEPKNDSALAIAELESLLKTGVGATVFRVGTVELAVEL